MKIAGTITESRLGGEQAVALSTDLELRDLFAGFALAGVMAGKDAGDTNPRWVAVKAYDLADAMLAQRAESKKR